MTFRDQWHVMTYKVTAISQRCIILCCYTEASQARSLVVSSLPGNHFLVREGVGLCIAVCASMHVFESKLHSARASMSLVDCIMRIILY